MRADQLSRLEALRDRLVEVALADADPSNWTGLGRKPNEMTREERGDAKWCRSLAVQTVALTMQVQRLVSNPAAGGAVVPTEPARPVEQEPAEEDSVEAEVARFEAAAAEVLAARAVRAARDGAPKR
jgi:hypothetical protein